MSTPSRTPAPNGPNVPLDGRLTFPPFPQAPAGVTITPFKAFKQHGIQMFARDENDIIERDGLGIPTVELRKKHDTDACKTETRRKRKAKSEQSNRAMAPGVRREWWEQWMENEHLKSTGPFNPHIRDLDKLNEAAADFKKSRTWPADVLASWEQFRLFVGLHSNAPVQTRTDKTPQEDESDSDDEVKFEETANVVEAQSERRPTSDDKDKDLWDGEEQTVGFLNDPELTMKIFLSSYIRKQGLIWFDRNLTNIPRFLEFFISFLIRNRVFLEVEFDRALKRSLGVVELAQKELILTSKIAKQLPDDFSKSCRTCWGPKGDGFKPVDPVEGDKKRDSEEIEDAAHDKPDTKRTKLDAKREEAVDVKIVVDKFEAELKSVNVEVIKIDDDVLMKDAEKLHIKDNLTPDTDVHSGWGQSEAWGSTDNDTDAPSSWGQSGGWGSTDDGTDPWAPAPVIWDPPTVYSLLSSMGPTALPITHTTGVVEYSVRRIKSFTAPPAPRTLHKSPLSAEEDPDAVDVELERRFVKVVLGPWLEWDDASGEMPHMAKPRILETSRGPVQGLVKEDGQVEPVSAEAPEGVKPHDPFNDDITVFVEPAVLPMLSPGLGLGGTWVQMAREQDFAGDGEKRKKKKGKSKKVATRYWYMDELILILPSYHT